MNDKTISPPKDHDGIPQEESPSLVPTKQKPYPQVVYVSKPMTPETSLTPEKAKEDEKQQDDLKKKHEESKQKYPDINLGEKEFVIEAIERYPYGFLKFLAGIGGLILLILLVMPIALFFPAIVLSPALVAILVVIALILVGVGFLVAKHYGKNKLFITSENITLVIQEHLFKTKGQTIPIIHIETITFRKEGLVQSMMDIGSLEIIAEGENRDTYRFFYLESPEKWSQKISNIIESYRRRNDIISD